MNHGFFWIKKGLFILNNLRLILLTKKVVTAGKLANLSAKCPFLLKKKFLTQNFKNKVNSSHNMLDINSFSTQVFKTNFTVLKKKSNFLFILVGVICQVHLFKTNKQTEYSHHSI